MLRYGEAALRDGYEPKYVVSGMRHAIEAVTAVLMTAAKPVLGEQLLQIAVTAASSDRTSGKIVVEAMKRAGKDGLIEVVDGTTQNLELEVQEGMAFDRGFLSPQFVTDHERQECVLENSYILIHEDQIGSMRDLLPVLELIAKEGKPILVIAADLGQEALSTLIVNKQRGTLQCAAVKSPGMGDRRAALLDDIAVLTGGRAFTREVMRRLENTTLADLGRAKKVIITKDETTIIGGAGSQDEIEGRIKQLRHEIEATAAPYDQAKLQERLARLVGAVAVIRAAGQTSDDLAESRYKVESALGSCRSAVENGYVVGGGASYFHARQVLAKLVPANGAERAGIEVVRRALSAPLEHFLQRSRVGNPERTLKNISKKGGTAGFNIETGQIEDLVAAGVLDSAKALKGALELALSHAEGILTTSAWDTTTPTAQEHAR